MGRPSRSVTSCRLAQPLTVPGQREAVQLRTAAVDQVQVKCSFAKRNSPAVAATLAGDGWSGEEETRCQHSEPRAEPRGHCWRFVRRGLQRFVHDLSLSWLCCTAHRQSSGAAREGPDVSLTAAAIQIRLTCLAAGSTVQRVIPDGSQQRSCRAFSYAMGGTFSRIRTEEDELFCRTERPVLVSQQSEPSGSRWLSYFQ